MAGMRATLDESLPDTCEIVRNDPEPDGAGGETDDWGTVATVACRISPLARSDRLAELEVAARITAIDAWEITLPAGTDVTALDRLLSGGRTFEVTSVLVPRSWEIGSRVLAQEIT